MTNTDEAYRRYCESHGVCNRVVFDAAFQMGRESRDEDVKELTEALESIRDGVLHERWQLAEAGLDSDQVNAVLGVIDDAMEQVDCLRKHN